MDEVPVLPSAGEPRFGISSGMAHTLILESPPSCAPAGPGRVRLLLDLCSDGRHREQHSDQEPQDVQRVPAGPQVGFTMAGRVAGRPVHVLTCCRTCPPDAARAALSTVQGTWRAPRNLHTHPCPHPCHSHPAVSSKPSPAARATPTPTSGEVGSATVARQPGSTSECRAPVLPWCSMPAFLPGGLITCTRGLGPCSGTGVKGGGALPQRAQQTHLTYCLAMTKARFV